jgi:hypothetical protein
MLSTWCLSSHRVTFVPLLPPGPLLACRNPPIVINTLGTPLPPLAASDRRASPVGQRVVIGHMINHFEDLQNSWFPASPESHRGITASKLLESHRDEIRPAPGSEAKTAIRRLGGGGGELGQPSRFCVPKGPLQGLAERTIDVFSTRDSEATSSF